MLPPQPAEPMPFARGTIPPVRVDCSSKLLEFAQGPSSTPSSAIVVAPTLPDWRDVKAFFSVAQGDLGQADGNRDDEVDEVGEGNEVDEVYRATCTGSEDGNGQEQRTRAATKRAAAALAPPTLIQAREMMRMAAACAVHGAR